MPIAVKFIATVTTVVGVLSTTLPVAAQSVELSDRYSTAFKSPAKREKVTINGIDLKSSLRLSVGYDDNIFRSQTNKQSSAFLRADVFASANKEGDGFQTFSSVRGSTSHHPANDEADEVFLRAFNFTQFELGENTQVEFISSYIYDEEAREDERIPQNFVQDVADQEVSSKAFVSHVLGDFGLTVSGGLKRELNEDTLLNNGLFFERSDANHTLLETAIRGSISHSEGLETFAEVGYADWRFDNALDRNGIQRGSEGYHAAIGSYFELDQISGEVAVGYRNQRFPAPQFEDLEAVTFDAWLDWKLDDSTSVILIADTLFEEETVSSRAGTLTRSVEGGIYHYLLDNLRINASSRYEFEESVSGPFDDYSLTHKVGVDYEFQPGVLSSVEYRYTDFDDGADSNSYTNNRVSVSLKLTR